MDKETSSRVSSIASTILSCEPTTTPATPEEYNSLLAIAKTLAGSALSQDETPGQDDQPEFTDVQKATIRTIIDKAVLDALRYFNSLSAENDHA